MKKRQPDPIRVAAAAMPLDVAAALRQAAPVLLVLGAWLAFHPYVGILHDSRLYVVQALRALHPDVFDRDFFFAFGSQDDFTIFSRLLAPLIDRFGLSAATMILVVAGQALWLSGAAALAQRLASDAAGALCGLVLLAVMPTAYGGWHVLSYAEGFATPRLFAEGFALWALWALANNRLATAGALVAAGALVHPLVTVTAVTALFLFLMLRDWRWCLPAIAGAAGVLAAALAGVSPFDRLTQTIDPEWLAVLEQRNVYLFPALWKGMDWCKLAMAVASLAACAVVVTGWQRRLIVAVALAGLGGVLATYLGGDVWHNLFIVQVQPYRALWLLQVVAYLGTGILFARLWRLQPDGFPLITLIAFAWLVLFSLHDALGLAVGGVAYGVAVQRLRGALRPVPNWLQAVILGIAGALLGLLVLFRGAELMKVSAAVTSLVDFWFVWRGLTFIEATVGAAVALTVLRFLPRSAGIVLPAAALAVAVAAAAEWNRCSGWQRAIASDEPVPVLESLLAPDAQVYWEDDVRGAWFLLRRASYVSAAQGAGIAFQRATAIAFRDRAAIVQPLTSYKLVDTFRDQDAVRPSQPDLTRDLLATACRKAPELDAMVLSRAVPGAFAVTWDSPAPLYDGAAIRKDVPRPPVRRFYLYRCAELR